ncbi:hypothetical protein Pmani_020640 [Petrolisthes manimaculis]|uniref:Uncharacterized protein n=1 Tax=Petrolisthes manimaculis TaxID=1843537 RepID=A0AAE1PIA1_9EUCA|nr:hypothetical protein Pmani_020640 [Petrolisthes manimaculis]
MCDERRSRVGEARGRILKSTVRGRIGLLVGGAGMGENCWCGRERIWMSWETGEDTWEMVGEEGCGAGEGQGRMGDGGEKRVVGEERDGERMGDGGRRGLWGRGGTGGGYVGDGGRRGLWGGGEGRGGKDGR